MLRATALLIAIALPASGAHAQTAFEVAPTRSAFTVVKPSGKPYATAPIRAVAPSDRPAAPRRAAPLGGGATFVPDAAQEPTEDRDAPSPDDTQAQAQAQAQPQPAQPAQRQAANAGGVRPAGGSSAGASPDTSADAEQQDAESAENEANEEGPEATAENDEGASTQD